MTKLVWKNSPIDNHFWAFYYFCKRMGDRVRVIKYGDGTADLIVHRNDSR